MRIPADPTLELHDDAGCVAQTTDVLWPFDDADRSVQVSVCEAAVVFAIHLMREKMKGLAACGEPFLQHHVVVCGEKPLVSDRSAAPLSQQGWKICQEIEY